MMVKSKLSAALKQTLAAKFTKLMLAILCIALITSSTPLQGFAQDTTEATEEVSSETVVPDTGTTAEVAALDTEAAEIEATEDTQETDTTEEVRAEDTTEEVRAEDIQEAAGIATLSGGIATLVASETVGDYVITSDNDPSDPGWTYTTGTTNTITINNNGTYTIEDPYAIERTGYQIVIAGGLTNVNLTIKNVQMSTYGLGNIDNRDFPAALDIDATSTVTLTLVGTNSFTSTGYAAGVQYQNTTGTTATLGTLIIQGDGSLTASGGYDAAGIGTGSARYYSQATAGGTISIIGGTITATGSSFGAGIGSGYGATEGTYTNTLEAINISGGTVTATGGSYGGAGIGTGGGSSVTSITISGGNITATGGSGVGMGSVGIGSGPGLSNNTTTFYSKVDTISISGGTITATGGDSNAYGIGSDSSVSSTVDLITITGGSIKATPGSRASVAIANPVGANGNRVYLCVVPTNSGVDEVTVDGTTVDGTTYKRDGNHSDDDSYFYLYLTGEDHPTITAGGITSDAKWTLRETAFYLWVIPTIESGNVTSTSTSTSITVDASSASLSTDAESIMYAIVKGTEGEPAEGDWTASNTFEGLDPDTTYTVFVRYTFAETTSPQAALASTTQYNYYGSSYVVSLAATTTSLVTSEGGTGSASDSSTTESAGSTAASITSASSSSSTSSGASNNELPTTADTTPYTLTAMTAALGSLLCLAAVLIKCKERTQSQEC